MLAGLTMLCAHAMFKAALFMVVGIIDHASGTRDIRRLAWLGTPAAGVVRHRRRGHREHGGAATVPRLRGQRGRLRDADAQRVAGRRGRPGCWPVWSPGSVFTTIYSLRFLWGAFARKGLRGPSTRVPQLHRRRPASCSRPAYWPSAGLVFGLTPGVLENDARALRRLRTRRVRLPPGAVARVEPAAAAVGRRAGGRHRVVHRPGAAAAGRGPAGCRSATPTASTTRPARPGVRRVQGDRRHPARFAAGDAVGHPADPGAAARRGAGRSAPATDPDAAVLGGPAAAGGRAADGGGRARGHRAAQPAGRGAAGRRHRLRLRRDLRLARGAGPGADAVPGGDADAGDLRAGAAHPARRGRSGGHAPAAAAAGAAGTGGRRHGHRCWPRSRWPRAPPRRSRPCCPTPPTTAATAPTPSTSSWSTSGPGTPSARSRYCWWPRPASRPWCSGTGDSAPRHAFRRPPASPISGPISSDGALQSGRR